MRIRTVFSKTEAMQFTGHLDLHRTLERTMRRGNLPLAYSQGFNPRPKLTLASALSLGYTSECEVADFWLKEELNLPEIKAALLKAAPPGIIFHQTEEVDLKAPKLQTTLRSAIYQITLPQPDEGLEERLAELLATEEIIKERVRKGKKRVYNLRDLILDGTILSPDEQGRPRLQLHLAAEAGKTGRPSEFMEHLGLDPLACQVHRLKIEFGE